MTTERPGGPPFMNRMPQSVIDRFEEEQRRKTAVKDPVEPVEDEEEDR